MGGSYYCPIILLLDARNFQQIELRRDNQSITKTLQDDVKIT